MMEDMATEVKVTNQNQEQFLLLAKSAKGAALAALISQVLEAPGVYVFGELLDMQNVKELASGDHAATFRLLTVFAYGTYGDYMGRFKMASLLEFLESQSLTILFLSLLLVTAPCLILRPSFLLLQSVFLILYSFLQGTPATESESSSLPALSDAQKNKLRHLSVVTLAAKVKCIPYSVLLDKLHLKNVRQLEDLIIEAIYADVVRGTLDQRNQRLEVDYSIGRDIRREDLSAIAHTLQDWCQGCEAMLGGIEEQVSRANQQKEQHLSVTQQIEAEVSNLKKTIKVTTAAATAAAVAVTSQDPEQHMVEMREAPAGPNQRQPSKKAAKGKGLRGSAKIWSKSN